MGFVNSTGKEYSIFKILELLEMELPFGNTCQWQWQWQWHHHYYASKGRTVKGDKCKNLKHDYELWS